MTQAPQTVTVTVNDEPRTLAAPATLAQLLAELGQAGRPGVAAAVNGEVVARALWATRLLAPQDRVLVIKATQGG
jgi:sulfur carrier protein